MNVSQPISYHKDRDPLRYASAAWIWICSHRKWLMIVVMPTVLVAAYYLLLAANQYESEAHFLVRSTGAAAGQPDGLGQALSFVGVTAPNQNEAASVGDYLDSHDAVAALERNIDLVDMFRRPETDFFSRLRPSPKPETLLRFYRKHVDVDHNSDTGLTTLKVRAFRPEDSYAIINNLLRIGERRVNELNQRAYESAIGAAKAQLEDAEQSVSSTQRAVTAFRQLRRDIDPTATGQAQLGLVTTLQTRVAELRARQTAMLGAIRADSPQAKALAAEVNALQAQVGTASGRLTGGGNAVAANVGNYQELQLRQQFAAKRYEAAATAFEKAREQAQRQQLFIVRVVDPNLPVKSLYPKGFKNIVTVFLVLALAYGIGWLIAAGVREHAA